MISPSSTLTLLLVAVLLLHAGISDTSAEDDDESILDLDSLAIDGDADIRGFDELYQLPVENGLFSYTDLYKLY